MFCIGIKVLCVKCFQAESLTFTFSFFLFSYCKIRILKNKHSKP